MEIKEHWKIQALPLENFGNIQFIDGERIKYESTLGWFYIRILFDYYENGQPFNGGIAFEASQAYRYTSDIFNKSPNDFSGILVEYIDSAWQQELYKRNTEIAESCGIRHFALHFRGHGTDEIITQNFKVLETKQGLLEL